MLRVLLGKVLRSGSLSRWHLLSGTTLQIAHRVIVNNVEYIVRTCWRSLREDLGLTVTEAMWKYQSVIGTPAAGLRARIIDGQNGFIADVAEICAQDMLKIINNWVYWRRLGGASARA